MELEPQKKSISIGWFVALALFVWNICHVYNFAETQYKSDGEYIRLATEYINLSAKNDSLSKEIIKLKNINGKQQSL